MKIDRGTKLLVDTNVLLEATARYVVVTGESLMAGYARAGRFICYTGCERIAAP